MYLNHSFVRLFLIQAMFSVYGHKRYTVIQMVNESLMTLEFALLGGVFIPYLHHSQAGTVARPPEA